MMELLDIVIFVALGTVALVLFAGLFVMTKGGETGRKYSNKLMQLRVLAQFIAVMILFAVIYFTKMK